jgi:hypothetical protein
MYVPWGIRKKKNKTKRHKCIRKNSKPNRKMGYKKINTKPKDKRV